MENGDGSSFLIVLVVILTFFSITLGFITVLLAYQLKNRRPDRHPVSRQDPQAILTEVANPLVHKRDPLGAVVKFMYAYENGQATTKQAYIASQLLIQVLEESWGLKNFPPYHSIVSYDPTLHRMDSHSSVNPGDSVLIVEPGWKINNKTIKYPFVLPETNRN
jgi:hypothetical protein